MPGPRSPRCSNAWRCSPGTSDWGTILEEARRATHPRPEWIIDVLRDELPGDVPVFTDACEIGYRMHADWIAHGPRRFFYPSNYITLGWAFPAAVGAAVGLGGRPVVSVSGDGGFVMTAQELATAARYRLRVVALVHNDSTYGAIKNIQQRAHGERYLDVDLNNPDFPQLAAAFGVHGCKAGDPDAFRARSAAPWLMTVPPSSRSPTAGDSSATSPCRRPPADDFRPTAFGQHPDALRDLRPS